MTETVRNLARKNKWAWKASRGFRPAVPNTKPKLLVQSRLLRLLPNGNPIPKGTEGMTDKIRELVKLGKAKKNENRDYGYELYVQHELNGGRESPNYGCTHPDVVYVVDGHKGRITTGNTLVWEFCTECASMNGDGPSEFYSELHIELQDCTQYGFDHKAGLNWTEILEWKIVKSPFALPDVCTVDEAREILHPS